MKLKKIKISVQNLTTILGINKIFFYRQKLRITEILLKIKILKKILILLIIIIIKKIKIKKIMKIQKIMININKKKNFIKMILDLKIQVIASLV